MASFQLDMDNQRYQIDQHKRQLHEQWVSQHQAATRFDIETSRIRALVLVNEAWRLEKAHLQHQLAHVRKLIVKAKQDAATATIQPRPSQKIGGTTVGSNNNINNHLHSSSPSSPCAGECACLRAPIYRTLTPKFRAMNLLQRHFDAKKLETAVDNLRRTYASDHAMMDDLLFRYGPEPTDVNPSLWLRSVEDRIAHVDKKWQQIGTDVRMEMQDNDQFQTVIRNLSIMRIFLEGSQANTYSCDFTERGRRDAFHQAVLDKLADCGTLFLNEDRTTD
jgi:hypothetical protein